MADPFYIRQRLVQTNLATLLVARPTLSRTLLALSEFVQIRPKQAVVIVRGEEDLVGK